MARAPLLCPPKVPRSLSTPFCHKNACCWPAVAVRSGARDLAGLIYRLRREAESRRHAVRPAVAGTHHLPGFVDEVVVVDAIPHFAEYRLLAVRPQEYRQLAPGQAYGHDLSGI